MFKDKIQGRLGQLRNHFDTLLDSPLIFKVKIQGRLGQLWSVPGEQSRRDLLVN